MRRAYGVLGLFLGLVLLQSSAGAGAPPEPAFTQEASEESGREEAEALAGLRLPRLKKPAAPKQAAPKAEPPATGTPSAPPPAAPTLTFKGFLDPKVARTLFNQRMGEAQKQFPHLYGKPKQEHHVHPIYLGGPKNGPTVELDPAYHQLVTNAFRKQHPYGQPPPTTDELQKILRDVYTQYPLPGFHF
jgi:hypothetical protein